MKVAVVSAIFGGYDDPVFAPQSVPCVYKLVSDGLVEAPPGSEHHIYGIGDLEPRLAGKFVKCRPWEFIDADLFVWMDGSFEPKSDLVAQMIDDLGDGLVAFHPHPDRSSVMREADFSRRIRKYPAWDVMAQARHYVQSGFPDDFGLWAGGLFIWRDCLQVRQLGQLWLDEICRWTVQDQLSLPYVLWRCGIQPRELSGGLLTNRRFRIRRHRDGS